ncbi:MAG: chemotaxis protein CheA [Yoonia sp.]|uniref:chemotaxis protein CheA n=1 Tax=Yoonia sp. TaxID=2212373 RepID=UPI003EF79248
MITDSAILDAFFEECEDLLAALTDGLAAICDGQTDPETVNAVFRAVHSIKGAAGAFSMDELVGFAHKFETVLDAMRAGQLDPDPQLLRVLQKAGDVLSELVDLARDNVPAERDKVDPVLASLQSFLGPEEPEEQDFVFEALTLDFDSPAATVPYLVTFHPTAEFYTNGNDPFLLLRALAELGDVEVQCDVSQLPKALADFDSTHGYLGWRVIVHGQSNDLPIREVFEFVDELCAFTVVEYAEDAQSDIVEPPAILVDTALAEVASPDQDKATAPPPLDKVVRKPAQTLRVDLDRVDRLINAVGELIINQSVISQRIEEAALPSSSEVFADLDDYKHLAREIQEGVMAIRAQPVKPLFQRMQRIAREAADSTGKDIHIVTDGENTEVDKIVVERLADPLTHMIRNAVDHGIESNALRVQNGKSEKGTLTLKASQSSGSIIIQIIDDGAGLNRPRIRDIAVKKGLIAADAQLSEPEIDQLLFAPGFSTAAEVTNLSGRGVGMDVVKTAITDLGGKIAINSVTGVGTTFSINLPLTLAVMDGMIINVGDQTMVVPISSVLETIRPQQADLAKIGPDNDLLRVRGEYVPVVDLAARLGTANQTKALWDKVLLLVQSETVPQCALAVDDIYDQRQVVVKSMVGNYGSIPGISGATILGDGKIALIVDTEHVTAAAQRPITAHSPFGEEVKNVKFA